MPLRLSSYYVNPAALCVYAGILLAAFFLDRLFWPLCILLIALAALFSWIFNLHRMQAISEIPLSSIASAAQGYVELLGKSLSLLPLKSPLRGLDCVWFRYWIYARDTYGLWQLQEYNASHNRFGLQDSSGYCEIDPAQAEIIASDRHILTRDNHQYIEDVLRVGRRLYVLGELDSGNDTLPAQRIKQETGELITQWKSHPVKFHLRFDLDRDGKIDMQEWELARQQAYHEVQTRHETLANHLVPLVTQPKNTRLFLISGISPHELRASYRFWMQLHFVMLIASIIGSALLLLHHA